MKWGVRRYQNPDGTLTAAGRRRQKRNDSGESEKKVSSKPKKMKDMSDDELRAYKSRLQLEKDVIDLEKQISGSTSMSDVKKSKAFSEGKEFILSTGKYILGESLKSAGKSYLEKKIKDKLGLNEKSELEKLKNTYQKLDYKRKIESFNTPNNSNKKDEIQEDISDLIREILEEEKKK